MVYGLKNIHTTIESHYAEDNVAFQFVYLFGNNEIKSGCLFLKLPKV